MSDNDLTHQGNVEERAPKTIQAHNRTYRLVPADALVDKVKAVIDDYSAVHYHPQYGYGVFTVHAETIARLIADELTHSEAQS